MTWIVRNQVFFVAVRGKQSVCDCWRAQLRPGGTISAENSAAGMQVSLNGDWTLENGRCGRSIAPIKQSRVET